MALASLGRAQSLEIGGQVEKPHTYSVAELKEWARPVKTEQHTYSGVLLKDLLDKAGVPAQHDLKGKWMAAYVVAQGQDGYRVVFSLAELDPLFGDNEVWVALAEDGKGFRLVVPREKRNARWVRDVQSVRIELAR